MNIKYSSGSFGYTTSLAARTVPCALYYFPALNVGLTEIKLASTKKKSSRSKNQKDSNSGRIILRNSTIAKLKELSKGEGNRETYDKIILRLIKSYKDNS
jgi:hypothetical protein